MIQVGNKYVSSAIYLVGFRSLDVSVRLKQGDAERIFGPMFNAQSQQTNLPDAFDPNAARLTFNANHKTLSISQAACQLQLEFERDDIHLDEQLAIVKRNVYDFHRRLLTFKPQAELSGMALILNLNYPSSIGKAAMQQHLYERFFINQEGPGTLASAAFQLGFKTRENFFLNYSANIYELRIAHFDPPISSSQPINVADVPLVEEGLGVKIDVNDKPRVGIEPYDIATPDALIEVALNFAESRIDQILDVQY